MATGSDSSEDALTDQSDGSSNQQNLCANQWLDYQQVLSNNLGHSMPSGVWALALLEMESKGGQSASELIDLYRTALSQCPYSLRLWCQLIDYQVRLGAAWPDVLNTCEAALNSGIHCPTELATIREKMATCAAAYGASLTGA